VLFGVDKPHCGLVDNLDDTFFQDGGKEPKVFAEKFLDEEKGRPLWSRWIARQQNGTLDQIDRPRGATKGP